MQVLPIVDSQDMFKLGKNGSTASLVALVCTVILIAVYMAYSTLELSDVGAVEVQDADWQGESTSSRELRASPTVANGPENRIARHPHFSGEGNLAEAVNTGQVPHASPRVSVVHRLPPLSQNEFLMGNDHSSPSTETIAASHDLPLELAEVPQQITMLEDASTENRITRRSHFSGNGNLAEAMEVPPDAHISRPVRVVRRLPPLPQNEHPRGNDHSAASTQATASSLDSQKRMADARQQFTTLEDVLQKLDKLDLSNESVSLLKQLRQFRLRDLNQIWSELDLHFSNTFRLPLMTAVQSGIYRNLTAQNQRVNVDLVESTILQAESQFEPQLNLNLNNNNGSSALSPVGGAPAAVPGTDNDQNSLSFTSQLAVPNTLGGTLQLANSLIGINDSLESVSVSPMATYVQPLLRGAGRNVNLSGIRAAELNTLAAGRQAEETVFQVAAQIKVAYLDLFLAQENLRIFDWIVQVAEFQDRWISARKEAGAESSLNVRRGRTGLGNLKLQLEQATQQALLAERVLKELMLLPEVNVGSPIKLQLEDIQISKDAVLPPLDRQQFTALARQLRPELQRLNLQIEAFDQNLIAAQNQIRPQVDLVGSVAGQLSSAETGMGVIEDEFHQVSIGINTNFPLRGNQAARAAARQVLAQRRQFMIVREQQDIAIVREVNDSVDQLVFAWRRIQVAKEVIENAILAYIGEILTVQRADLLLQATQTLADAFTNFNQAVRDYYVAEISLQLATGSVLNHKLQLFR